MRYSSTAALQNYVMSLRKLQHCCSLQADAVPVLGSVGGQYYSAVAAALTAGDTPALGAHTQEFYTLFEQQAAAVSSTREVCWRSLAQPRPARLTALGQVSWGSGTSGSAQVDIIRGPSLARC